MTKRRYLRLRRVRKLGVLLVSVVLSAMFMISAVSASGGYDFPAGSATVRITLDSEEVLVGEAAIIRSVTYVPLRSFSELAGADSVSWDANNATATVKKGSTVIHVTDGSYYVEASGRYFYTAEPVLNINDRLFVPVRPLAKAFCVEVDWSHADRTVVLRSTGKTLTTAAAYYDADDLYWLSRIISAEASGESLYGQIAVGNVVLNRVASKQFPNTVYGVIFDRAGGVQFSPVAMGTIYRTPTATATVAAKICLEGYRISDGVLFFMNPRISTSNWISKNRPFAFRIGNHDFYY